MASDLIGSISGAEPMTNYVKESFVQAGITDLQFTKGPQYLYSLFQGGPVSFESVGVVCFSFLPGYLQQKERTFI